MAKINTDLSRAPDDQKFKELILYVAQKSMDDPRYGHTKLNKILFYAEFLSFGYYGRAISWQPFQKLKWGPAARRLLPIQNRMVEAGECILSARKVYNYDQTRLEPLRKPDITRFTPRETELVDEVLQNLRPLGAGSISDLSHRFIGWRVARFGETIPYETVLLSTRQLTAEEKSYALELTPSSE